MSNDPSISNFCESDNIKDLLERNRAWAERISKLHPGLFPGQEYSQKPWILWIGCSDSRVPETSLLDLLPGEVFVHRNIANVVPDGDVCSQSVIQYAVDVLKVKYIIVCGHHDCGGIKAALKDEKLGFDDIDSWINYIRVVRKKHQAELDAIDDIRERWSRLVELNVIAQVHRLKRMSNVLHWRVPVYGLVYGVGTGHAVCLDIPDAESHGIKDVPE